MVAPSLPEAALKPAAVPRAMEGKISALIAMVVTPGRLWKDLSRSRR